MTPRVKGLVVAISSILLWQYCDPAAIPDGSISTARFQDKEEAVSLENRIGFNFQSAYSAGYNPAGASTAIRHTSAAIAGLSGPGGYQSLFSDARSRGNATSSGSGTPDASANTQSEVNQEGAWGSGTASVSQGTSTMADQFGSSYHSSIDMGNGYQLLNNLNAVSGSPSPLPVQKAVEVGKGTRPDVLILP